ncbi:MAG: BTAD domain-containing putative transcriptional regulator [Acidiferrobacterales bacterium]
MQKPPVPVKITRPQPPPGTLTRSRLFQRLDNGRKHGIIWVQAPPGSGKTTLVSSYLTVRGLPCLWFQVDRHDSDPATFFHYLGRAAQSANPRRRQPLPALTPEYAYGIPVFARRFFELVASRLKRPCLWVFDNFQELPEDSLVPTLLYDSLSVIPTDISVVILSRTEPPAALGRLAVHRQLTVIDNTELALTQAEVRAIARTHRVKLNRTELDELHDETRGWAAGLTLLLEAQRTPRLQLPALAGHTRKLVFDYFANEVLSGLDPVAQQILLRTAFLPKVTPTAAERLAGASGALQILNDLARRNYFTVTHTGPNPGYEYHALFRTFLQARVGNTLSPEQLDALRIATAGVLIEENEVEPAADLLCDARDWPALAHLCITNAESLLAQGRGQTLAAWIHALPEDVRETSPWLLYWLGVHHHPLDPARRHFAKAFDLFRADNDFVGQLLSWASITECYNLLWDEFVSWDPWLAQFDSLIQSPQQFPSPQIERRVVSGLVMSLMNRCPQHPRIGAWVGRLWDLLPATEHPGERIGIAASLFHHAIWTGDLVAAGRLISLLRSALNSKSTAMSHQLIFLVLEAAYCWHNGELERCLKIVAEALALSAASGVHILDPRIAAQALFARLSMEDADGSAAILSKLTTTLNRSRRLDASLYYHQTTWFHVLTRDLQQAEIYGREALMLANQAGTPFPRALCHLAMGFVLVARHECGKAMPHIVAALHIGSAMKSPILQYIGLLADANCRLQQDNEVAACLSLRKALVLGKHHGYTNVWGAWQRPVMTRLCSLALVSNIEPDHVRSLIGRQGLLPEDSSLATDAWPWPIKIYTLGRFRLEISGQPPKVSGKGQIKPVELLKTLIAFGGRSVPEERLAEALWPNTDGDTAQQAFATTLHRLRRLLGQRQALRLENNCLSLDSRIVWLDMWTFERCLDPTIPTDTQTAHDTRYRITPEETLKLYQGDFLAHESVSWGLNTRERLRSKFQRYHRRLGESLELTGALDQAIEWYEWGIEIEPLAEETYYSLMQCHRQLRHHSAAIAVYLRCEKILLTELGLAPGTEIRMLYQDVLDSLS